MASVHEAKVSDELIRQLDKNTLTSPLLAAKVAVELVRGVVSGDEWFVAKDLLAIFKEFSNRLLLRKDTYAPFVRNVILRCLKVIRDDYKVLEESLKSSEDSPVREPSSEDNSHAVSVGWDVKPTYDRNFVSLKDRLMENLDEIMMEFDLNASNMGNQAPQHVHSNDVILTVGHSSLVETFLKAAWKGGRTFHVVVVEGGHEKPGHFLAENLEAEGIEVTLVPDSSVFAVMSSVSKVVLGAHLLLANGGLRAIAGSHAICTAAAHYAVPVLVCTSSYELVPEYPGFAENLDCTNCRTPYAGDRINIYHRLQKRQMPFFFSPLYDYVPPEMVSILVFSSGGNVPSYMYSLRNELYSPDDIAWELNPSRCKD